MDVNELVGRIISLEWKMFTSTHNAGGRASCQDDGETFDIMRRSQHLVWSLDTLEAYLSDLETAEALGDNLVTYKYAYMMRFTFPDEYEKIKDRLPAVSAEKKTLADSIAEIFADWTLVSTEKYPRLASMGRPRTTAESGGGRWAAIDNYLYSELLTYSEKTLSLCLRDAEAAKTRGENLSLSILANTARLYGYPDLDTLEASLNRKINLN